MVAADDAAAAIELLGGFHPGTAKIGQLSDDVGTLTLPGLAGDSTGLRAS
jgi:hypothetical protein